MQDSIASGPDGGNAGANDGVKKDSLKEAFDAAAAEIGFADTKVLADTGPLPAANEEGFDENSRDLAGEGEEHGFERAGNRAPRRVERFARSSEKLSPPAHWDAQKRQAFARLPNEAKKIVLDLGRSAESHLTKKSMELSEERKFAGNVRSLIHDGHRAQMRRSGIKDEVQGIGLLLQLNDVATRDPASYVRWVAEAARLDPRIVFPELSGSSAPPPQAGPELRQLQETIRQLSGKVSTFERAQIDGTRRLRERQEMAAREAMARFANESDRNGIPKYPHFARLQGPMMALMASHPSLRSMGDLRQRLARAYEIAVLADPELQGEMMESAMGRREAEWRRSSDLAKARRAKAPLRAAPTNSPNRKAKSLDEALRQAMGKLGI